MVKLEISVNGYYLLLPWLVKGFLKHPEKCAACSLTAILALVQGKLLLNVPMLGKIINDMNGMRPF